MNRVITPTVLFRALVPVAHLGWFSFLVLFAALAPRPVYAADPISIKVATLAPEGTAWIRILRANTQEIEKRLQGRVKFTIYGGGVQGSEKIVVQKMKTGQLQGGALTVVGLASISPELTALNLPMVFSSDEHRAATRIAMTKRLEEKIWNNGFKMVNWGGMGAFYLFGNHRIQRPEDLIKGRVWVWNDDPVFNEMALEIGAAPIPLAIPDVLPALNTGQVDTVLMHPFALVSLQWFTQMKYRMAEPILFGLGGMVIVRSVWEKLTPADQQVFLEVNEKWAKVHKQKTLQDNKRAIELLDSQGIEVITPSQSDLASWNAVSKRTWDRLTGRAYTDEFLREMLRHRDEFQTNPTP